MTPWSRRTLIGVSAFLALAVLAVLGFYAVSAAVLLGLVRPSFDDADYGNMTFSGKGDEFYAFAINSDRPGSSVPRVYLRGFTSQIWYLPELTEAEVSAIGQVVTSGEDLSGRQYTSYSFGKGGYCAFADDKLTQFTVDRHDPVQIGASRRGEFVRLPIDKRTMIRLFGRPKEYRKSYQRPI